VPFVLLGSTFQIGNTSPGKYNIHVGKKRVGSAYIGASERLGCALLVLISVGAAALFAFWATFVYRPLTSKAHDGRPVAVLTTPEATKSLPELPDPSPTFAPTPTSTPSPSPTSTPSPTYTPTRYPTPSPTSTHTPTPHPTLPPTVFLNAMNHEYQKLNNCGPASLAAAASFFGVQVTQFDAAAAVKGGPEDKNVSPHEMVDYLHSLGLGAAYRVNGNEELMKRLLANDVPVIVHQWLVRPHDNVLVGHYRVLRGYDSERGLFIANDPYTGPQFTIPSAQFDAWWRPFNRGYIPVYQPAQAALVAEIVGEDWDEEINYRGALAQAQVETQSFADGYAYFNLGEAYLALGDPAAAVAAYDQAFTFEFPDHFLWYQFGPLEALNQVGDYQRVLDMTVPLLAQAGELEEARLQRGLAYLGLGDPAAARTELEKALAANSTFARAIATLGMMQQPAP